MDFKKNWFVKKLANSPNLWPFADTSFQIEVEILDRIFFIFVTYFLV